MIFFAFLDILMWIAPPHLGWGFWKWDSSGPVAVGDGYSIALQSRCLSPIGKAEYELQLELFGETERNGSQLGNIPITELSKGERHVAVFSGHAASNNRLFIVLLYRSGEKYIDVSSKDVSKDAVDIKDKKFLGTFSGNAYPLKFIPASILPPSKEPPRDG